MDSHLIADGVVTETLHEDGAAGRTYLEQEQDVTDIVEANRDLYNLADGVPRFGDGKRVASIPIVIWQELDRRGITRDPQAMRRWLNDPNNQAFRTLPGVL